MKGKIVRDIEGWISIALEENERGVIVDWDYVEEGRERFIPHGYYEVLEREKINPRIADRLRSE